MPLPTTIGARNAVARFRWPTPRRANANVASAPSASAPSSAPTAALDAKNSSIPIATITTVNTVDRSMPPSSARCSAAVVDDVARDTDAHAGAARAARLVGRALDRGQDGRVARHLAAREARPHDDDLQAPVLRHQRRRVRRARLRRVQLPLQVTQAIAQRRTVRRRAARAFVQRHEQRIEPRLALRQLVADRGEVRGRRQQVPVFPREAILRRAVRADTDHGAGGKRRQPIAHEAGGRRAPRGVLRFDRDDDRPEHLGARFQRVQVAHGQRLRRQQVRHVAPQRQARRDRRRHDRGQEGRPEDRGPVACGPARPAGAESTVGDGGVHTSRLCSGRATFPSVRRRRRRPASVQFRTRRAQNLAAGSAPDRQNHPPTMLDAPTKRRRLDTFSTE